MKNIKYTLVVLLFVPFAFAYLGSSSDNSSPTNDNDLNFNVDIINKPLSISKKTLNNAKEIAHINQYYKPSWIKEFKSVEISAMQNGQLVSAASKDDQLTQEQMNIMQRVDVGSNIQVSMKYIPDNNLSYNDVKEYYFEFIVNPENDATFSGGIDQLNKYLKEKAIDKIPDGTFEGYAAAVVKFTIDEKGKTTNVHIYESSRDEKVDALMLQTIQEMPRWKPAKYADGTKVKQEFAFVVGHMESCVINTINTRNNRLRRKD